MGLTVLVNAGPWLPVPPPSYGGIENVVATLAPELRRLGVRLLLAAAPGSTIEADRHLASLPEPHFQHLSGPYARMTGIPHAHMLEVVRELREGEHVDLVHDHLEVVGPGMLAAMGGDCPPVLHTLHWDLRKHPDFYSRFDGARRIWFNGVSPGQLERAPLNLRRQALGYALLAVRTDEFPYQPQKGDYAAVLGRFTREKAPDSAARICRSLGLPLRLAGPVGGHPDRDSLAAALRNPDGQAAGNDDVRFFRADVEPLIDGALIRWLGTLGGHAKHELIGSARAVLFPGRWHEPGGTAVVEALACGTPVVAMRRGCMPALIEHGVTGFLADDERDFERYLQRVDEIEPEACRRAAEERFSAAVMAERYLGLYEEAIVRSRGASPVAA